MALQMCNKTRGNLVGSDSWALLAATLRISFMRTMKRHLRQQGRSRIAVQHESQPTCTWSSSPSRRDASGPSTATTTPRCAVTVLPSARVMRTDLPSPVFSTCTCTARHEDASVNRFKYKSTRDEPCHKYDSFFSCSLFIQATSKTCTPDRTLRNTNKLHKHRKGCFT
eukprot:1146645-Pelagomonas_calceolata.AAC.5